MSRVVDPNQGSLAGIELESRPVDMNARNAFGRVPFVKYFNIDPSIFNEITPRDEEHVDALVLEPMLYKASAKHTRKRPYPNEGWVVLSPDEFAIVPSSAGAFAERIGARNAAQNEGLVKNLDTRTATAKRAGAHALQESVVPKLRNLAEGYHIQIGELHWLDEKIPRHYLAHTNELNMRTVAHNALESFLKTLDTIGSAHDWSDDRLEVSKLAMQKRLLAGRGGGTLEPKKDYWRNMIAVSGNHARAKKGVVVARLFEADNIIGRYLR